MYCNKCGTQNPDDAVYCKKCGSLMEPEDETRVSTKLRNAQSPTTQASQSPGHPFSGRRGASDAPLEGGEPEADHIFSIAPTLKFVFAGYVLAVLGAFLLVALFSLFLSPWVGVWPGVILGLALLLIPAYFHVKQRLVKYSLTDTTIEIDRGLVSRTTQNIPLRRVQDVTVSATVFQRMLGYGDITIDNASEMGGKVVLDNVDAPKQHADMILKQMRQLER